MPDTSCKHYTYVPGAKVLHAVKCQIHLYLNRDRRCAGTWSACKPLRRYTPRKLKLTALLSLVHRIQLPVDQRVRPRCICVHSTISRSYTLNILPLLFQYQLSSHLTFHTRSPWERMPPWRWRVLCYSRDYDLPTQAMEYLTGHRCTNERQSRRPSFCRSKCVMKDTATQTHVFLIEHYRLGMLNDVW